MNQLESLEESLKIAKEVCPPDEFACRQRNLLWELAEYVIKTEEIRYDS